MKQKALMVVLMLFAGGANAGIEEQAAQLERAGATYYVENCRSDIATMLKKQTYYNGKDVDGMLASFSNKKLTEEFLRSVVRHASSIDREEYILKRRVENFSQALSGPDVAGRCTSLAQMFDVYRTIGEAQENVVSDSESKAERDFLVAHANDPISIDYSIEVKAIGGGKRQQRPAKGTVSAIKLGTYLDWQNSNSTAWKDELWNAIGGQNKNVVYNKCLTEITDQWTRSFGYQDAILRAKAFVGGALDLQKVLRIVCSPS